MKVVLGLIALGLLLAACGATPAQPVVSTDSGSVADAATEPTMFVPGKKPGDGAYYFLRGNALPRGKALIFFSQSSDPFSQNNDRLIRAAYETGSVAINTYYVNYEASQPLRMQLGVVTFDTFVLLDGDGVRLKSIIHPSQKELQSLLR